MQKKYLLLILFLGCFFGDIFCQERHLIIENNQPKFEKLSSKEGLIHNSITAITQDSKGYMWFGSFNGLYKYDGYHFIIYKNSPDNNRTLIGNDIITLYKDKKGIIWIGTSQGLCKYNKNTDDFDKEIPILNNEKFIQIKDTVYCIYEDSFGILWIGTNVGLYQLTKKEEGYKITLHKSDIINGKLSGNIVKTIIEDDNKDLWVGTNKGLNKISINRKGKVFFKEFKHNSLDEKSLSDDYITELLIDHDKNLWVGTKNGLNKVQLVNDTLEEEFIKFYYNSFESNSLPHNYITTLTQDHTGALWIGTRYGGISKYSKGKFSNHNTDTYFEHGISSNEVTSIYESKNGVLWIGVIAGALNKLDLQKKKIAHYNCNLLDEKSLSDNIVNVIYEDKLESIWVGTHNGGLNRLVYDDNGKTSFIKYRHDINNKNSISSDNIFSFCEDNYGNFWAGTEDNGLNHIQLSKQQNLDAIKIKRYEKDAVLPSNNISILFKDSFGDIWIGSFDGDGLMRFTPEPFGKKISKIDHFKHNLSQENGLSSNNISYIYEDKQGVLWVGTYGGGLVKIIRDNENNPIEYHVIKNEPKNINSLSNNNVFSILEDTQDNLWIGTYGGGLNKIPFEERAAKKPKIVRYGKHDGLTNSELYGVLEDSSRNLWISSNKGIFKFNIEKEAFTNFQTNDGLQALNFRKFAFCKGKNGLMYFGGIKGFNVFNPNKLQINKQPPQVEIVDLKVFNESVKVNHKVQGFTILKKPISETDEIVLKSSHNAFSFEFAGLHYSSPEQNKYQYKLEGFDKVWNKTDAGRRYAAYSNLDPGEYVFKIKASNNDNIWSPNPEKIRIRVLPPWWKTWWAYLIYFLLIGSLMVAFRQFIVIRHAYQNNLKIEKIKQENIKNINKVKLEFFTNISHEFKTPLTLIMGPLQNLIASQKTNEKVKKSLLLMERNAENLYKLINQVLEFRKVEVGEVKIKKAKGDIVKFINEIIESFYFLAEKKNINLSYKSSHVSLESYFDWDKLEKILNNLISNCLKYTQEKGSVHVDLIIVSDKKESDKELVKIIISDTGIGIPKNQLSLIFNRFYKIDNLNRSGSMGSGIGLALTKTLVELHGGTINVQSEENLGSIFTVKLPLIKKGVEEIELDSYVVSEVSTIDFSNKQSFNISDEVENNLEEKLNTEKLPVLLMVEDNDELQFFIKESLSNEFTILKAMNGEEAVRMAINEVPNIIVSDIMMPLKDGIELCDELKRNNITNHIPIVLLTARASIQHRIEGLEVGADAYIAKPFHIKHLRVTIQTLLKQRQLLKDKFSASYIPRDNYEKETTKFEREFLEQIEVIIEDNMHNEQFGVVELGSILNFSRMQLYRKLKSISGMSANEFIREYRIKKAAQFLSESDMNISEIAYAVGFNNLSYFTKCFKKVYKMSPSVYLKQLKA